MVKHRWLFYTTSLLILSGFIFLSCSQTHKIIEKNILAAGGKENLSKVKNYSFKSGQTTYYVSTEGSMKMTEGREPIVTEVILVDKDQAKRNCFNSITELTGLQKSTNQCLAQLRAGLFTLTHFKNKLKFLGLKSFGPEELYMLSTNVNDLQVEFYLDSEEYTLKRLVLKGFDEEQNKLEQNHDFGPYQETDGVKIPSSWFNSQVGARGSTFEISDVKINQPLEKDFFSSLDINAGDVEIGEGSLRGNIIQSSFRRNILTVGTNWTDDSIQKAGLNTGDKLILQIGSTEVEIDFHESFPPRSSLGPGAKFLIPNRRGENYLIYMISSEFKELSEQLETLLPIQIKKK
jgi:hypothetical protein